MTTFELRAPNLGQVYNCISIVNKRNDTNVEILIFIKHNT